METGSGSRYGKMPSMSHEQFLHIVRTDRSGDGPTGHPGPYARQAKDLGLERLGVTDLNDRTIWSDWERDLRREGIAPMFGQRFAIDSGNGYRPWYGDIIVERYHAFPLLGAMSRQGIFTPEMFFIPDGLIGIVPYPLYDRLRKRIPRERLFLAVRNFGDTGSRAELKRIIDYARSVDAPIAATNSVWYTGEESGVYHSTVLRAAYFGQTLPRKIFTERTLEQLKNNKTAYDYFRSLMNNGMNFYPLHYEGMLKATHDMEELFTDYPEAIGNIRLINRRASVEHMPRPSLPDYLVDEGTAYGIFRMRCEDGMRNRYGDKPPKAVIDRFEYEIREIANRGLVSHFLIADDLNVFARENGIVDVGIGSKTGSMVCYLLYMTDVDPLEQDTSFERFIGTVQKLLGTLQLTTVADMDTSTDKAGQDALFAHMASELPKRGVYPYRIATFPTYGERGALRLLMKVFGYDGPTISRIQNLIFRNARISAEFVPFANSFRNFAAGEYYKGFYVTHPTKAVYVSEDIDGGYEVVRNKGVLPIVLIDKDEAEYWSNLDFVIMSGHTLRENILKHLGMKEEEIPLSDADTLRMIFQGRTLGIPLCETPYMRQMAQAYGEALGEKIPTIEDAINFFALTRPGARDGFATYTRRLSGQEPIEYIHQSLEPILKDTLGVIVFQEQVLRIGREIAGLTEREADDLRRAMTKERTPEKMASLKQRLIEGFLNHGLTSEQADALYHQMAESTKYIFLYGHAYEYAIRVIYVISWLKRHRTEQFFRSLFAHGKNLYFLFGLPEVYIREAARWGITVEPNGEDNRLPPLELFPGFIEELKREV